MRLRTFIAITMIAVLAALAAPPTATGQTRAALERDALALARVCASEIGLRGSPEECAAIARVLRARAARFGMTLAAMACVYSDATCDRGRRDARAWVAHLEADAREPQGWPALLVRPSGAVVRHAPWRAYVGAWRALLGAARGIVAGEVSDRCVGPVEHWGMRSGIDLERAQRAGWVAVDCGPTRNAFWALP